MKVAIVGFHLDKEDDWVAELACGHFQHVRHDPPWKLRPWVESEQGRKNRLGCLLSCVKCDDGAALDFSPAEK